MNIPLQQFLPQDVVASVKKSLATTGLRPEFLELEITESALMQDPDRSPQTLLVLRDLCIRLAIDDFTTGYSSLAHLKRFPLHKLKIDRSFIRDIPHDFDSEKIATTIVAMGRGLELKVLAGGVETEDQRKFLEKHSSGISLQPYRFGRNPGRSRQKTEAQIFCSVNLSPFHGVFRVQTL